MVCDHCMSHGLRCDEASVCQQCQLHGVPCVHRWCLKSSESRNSCEGDGCRYAHRDHLPEHDDKLPGYLICLGNLPEHLSKGRKRKLRWNKMHSTMDSHYSEVHQRQLTASAIMSVWAAEASEGTLETNHMPCGEHCVEEGAVSGWSVIQEWHRSQTE